LACSGPDEGGVGAVGVVAVGVPPRVLQVRIGCVCATDHGGFGFEVPLRSGSYAVLVATKKIGEENLAGGFVITRVEAGRWIDRGVRGVKIVVSKITVAGGLEGGNFGFGGRVGSVTANSPSGAEGEAGEDANDSDDGEELDQGEGRPASLSLGKPC